MTIIRLLLMLSIVFVGSVVPSQAVDVGKWRRHVIVLPNDTYAGNPFEVMVDATFTHTSSGTQLTLPGYYAGNNQWKIGFMPTKLGEWTYRTSSADPELDGITGSIQCVESGLPGILRADGADGRKWKFSDGPYVVPIALRMEFFSEPGSLDQMRAVAQFLKAHNLQMLETRLTEENGQFGGRHDFIFEGDWRNHQFDLAIWDRMEQRMEVLADLGLGGHIMFYSDDSGAPGWSGQSATEALVIRYAVARLAGFPVVLWNTGIDIAEYRSQADIDWFGEQIRSLDPYGHPVSSRYGGGSGRMVMSGQTFDSRGDRTARINDMTEYFRTSTVPVSMDDAWGEDRTSHPSKMFSPADIRRAFWKCLVAGGIGGLIRTEGGGCGANGFLHFGCFEEDLQSEQWLRLVNEFLQGKLGQLFGVMEPSPTLATNGHALADPGGAVIVVLKVGSNDRWDPDAGSTLNLNLRSFSTDFDAWWYDPRSGTESPLPGSPLSGGMEHSITSPSDDDWVLVLFASGKPSTPPPPSNLRVVK